jgi:hypothetical protein
VIEEKYQAAWAIEYPDECDTVTVFNILGSNLLVEGVWNGFPWDLKHLHKLLTEKPVEFDYLHVTRMLKSRASQLIKDGPFQSQPTTVQEGIARFKLQWPSIYRYFFLQELESTVSNMRKDPNLDRNADRLFLAAVRHMEQKYLHLMEVLCLEDDDDASCYGYSKRSWMKGELVNGGICVSLVPDAVEVPVYTKRVRGTRIVKPGREELARRLLTETREREFREAACMVRETDAELEKLCCRVKPKRMKCIQYAGRWIPYYRTIINDEKDTLFVICADRTLRIEQAEEDRPGSYPEEIFSDWLGWGCNNTYLVRFVNGTVGGFTLTCRAHRESEAQHASKSSKALPRARARFGQGMPERPTEGPKASHHTEAKQLVDPVLVGDATKNSDVIIARDYMVIHIGGIRIDFFKKKKRRDLVRFIHEWSQVTGIKTFSFREKAEDFAKKTGRTIECDRFEEDFFKGQSLEFRLLFEIVDKRMDLFRIRI